MEWLSSDTAVFDPLLSSPEELGWGWILFIMWLRELKLSDCGTLRIKGLCEERKASGFFVSRLTQMFWKRLLTLDDGVFPILELVSFMLRSSSKMDSVLERSLIIVGESMTMLCFGSVALSSNLLVVLSSKMALLSLESFLERAFSIKSSSLQEKKTHTFTFGYDILMIIYSICLL